MQSQITSSNPRHFLASLMIFFLFLILAVDSYSFRFGNSKTYGRPYSRRLLLIANFGNLIAAKVSAGQQVQLAPKGFISFDAYPYPSWADAYTISVAGQSAGRGLAQHLPQPDLYITCKKQCDPARAQTPYPTLTTYPLIISDNTFLPKPIEISVEPKIPYAIRENDYMPRPSPAQCAEEKSIPIKDISHIQPTQSIPDTYIASTFF